MNFKSLNLLNKLYLIIVIGLIAYILLRFCNLI